MARSAIRTPEDGVAWLPSDQLTIGLLQFREANGDGAGRLAEAVRELLEFSHGHADDPREILLPIEPVGFRLLRVT